MARAYARKAVVAAKVEGTYGSLETVGTTATETQLVYNDGAGIYSESTDLLDYNHVRTSALTPQQKFAGITKSGLTIESCVCGNGVGGTSVPFMDPLLQACGLAATTATDSTSSSTIYAPTTTKVGASVWVYNDGVLHKSKGTLFNAAFDFTAGSFPKVTFSGQGLHDSSAAGTFPSPTYPADKRVLVGAEALTITPDGLAAYSPVARSISFDLGNGITDVMNVNSTDGLAGFELTSRAPTASITFEADAGLTTPAQDWFLHMREGSVHAVTWTHKYTTSGSDDSNAVFSLPQAQVTGVSRSNDNGILTYTVNYAVTHTTDNTDLTITFNEPAS